MTFKERWKKALIWLLLLPVGILLGSLMITLATLWRKLIPLSFWEWYYQSWDIITKSSAELMRVFPEWLEFLTWFVLLFIIGFLLISNIRLRQRTVFRPYFGAWWEIDYKKKVIVGNWPHCGCCPSPVPMGMGEKIGLFSCPKTEKNVTLRYGDSPLPIGLDQALKEIRKLEFGT